MDGKTKCKLSELPLLRKIIDSNQYYILRGIEDIRITMKVFKKCRVVVLKNFSLNSLIWSLKKIDGSQRKTLDSCKHIQIVNSIAPTVADGAPYLSRLTYFLVSGIQLLKVFCFFVFDQKDQRQFVFSRQCQQFTLHFYIKGVLILQVCEVN